MFWASAPKRCKGKNIFGFDSTFCGDCLGYGQTDFIKQVLDDILKHVGLPKPLLYYWHGYTLRRRKGAKTLPDGAVCTLRKQKRLKVSLGIVAEGEYNNNTQRISPCRNFCNVKNSARGYSFARHAL